MIQTQSVISSCTKFCLLVLGITFIAACGPKLDEVEVQDDHGNVLERFTWNPENYAKQGRYQAFYPSGELLEESNYESDTLDGLRTLYYQNGNPQYQENYQMGQFHGTFKAFHENGAVELQGEYIDNAMQGEWKGYYDNGQLREVVLFEDNQENGPFVEYHANGNLKAEGTYKEGDTEHGILKEYNEEGVLVRKAECDMGICRTVWRLEEEPEEAQPEN